MTKTPVHLVRKGRTGNYIEEAILVIPANPQAGDAVVVTTVAGMPIETRTIISLHEHRAEAEQKLAALRGLN